MLLAGSGPARAAQLSGKVLLEEVADYSCSYPNNFVDVVKGTGSIRLVLPKGDGPVKGTGYAFAGPLILQGQVKSGVLHFPFSKGYSGGVLVYTGNPPVTIPAQNDTVKRFPLKSSVAGVNCSGAITWPLSKAIETWRITLDDDGENVAITGVEYVVSAAVRSARGVTTDRLQWPGRCLSC